MTRYVIALGAVGAVTVVTWLTIDPSSTLGAWGVGALFGLSVLSVFLPVRFFHGDGAQGFQLEGAVFIALLLTAGPGIAVVAAATSSLIAFSLRTRSGRKVLFNTGQNAIWGGAAAAAFELVGPGAVLLVPRTIAATAAAAIVMVAVNGALMAELVHRLDGRDRADALRDAIPLLGATTVGNGTAGVVLALLVTVSPWAVLPGALLLIGLHLGYRGYVRSVADRGRAERLNDLTRRLLAASTQPGAVETFLQDVAATLGASGAELVVTSSGERVVARHGDVPAAPADADVCEELLRAIEEAAPLRSRDAAGRQCLAAPLLHGSVTLGGLAVMGRRGAEPWDAGDMHLLATVANEAAVALRNVELISALERERARLEAETTKLGDIVDAASDGIVLLGDDGQVQAWNRAMTEITGTPSHEAVSHPWFVSLRVKDAAGNELLPQGDHVFANAMAGHRHSEAVLLQVLRRDGVWRWLRVTFAPVLREDAQPVGTVMVARDVTSEREVEELKSDFVATVSHELRTPLTPLKGFLATLAHRGSAMTPDQLAVVFDAMDSQVDRLEHLIADLLVIADLDRGAMNLERANVDLSRLVTAAVAEQHDDRIRSEVDEPLPAMGDEAALQRVLSALLSNALKHTQDEVVVSAEVLGDAAHVHVDDHGDGIAAWDQEKIFRRFHRLGDHLTRTQGPGLGLPIARALAQRMGGDVTVTSELGRGSRFTLRVPLARPRAVVGDEVSTG